MDFDDILDEEIDELVGAGTGNRTTSFSRTNDDGPSDLDLANARVAAVEGELARQRFVNVYRDYTEAGVPPVLLELARPVLEMPMPPVIDLSNEEHIDTGQLLRDMLDECKGFIQLGREQGSGITQDPPEQNEDRVLEAFRKVGRK
jgi:hypothetical protein